MKSLICLFALVCSAALCGSAGAAFVSGGSGYIAKELAGTYTQTVWVNKFDGNTIARKTTGTFTVGEQANYAVNLGTKTFKMVVIAPTSNSFSFSVSGPVLGVVASTGWTGIGQNNRSVFNVWGQYAGLIDDINSAFGSDVNHLTSTFFIGNSGSSSGNGSNASSGNNAARGFEIHNAGASGNPDLLTRSGNTFSGAVNAIGNVGAKNYGEMFAVLVEVPEPATMALWGMGAVGLAAFRFRRRK